MIHAIGRFFMALNKIGWKILYVWDDWDLTTLIGYGPWFILGIWMIFESRGDMPLLIAIFLVMILISIGGAITTFLVSLLKIAFTAVLVPIQKLAEWFEDYEDRTTGIGPYIESDKKAYGDIPSHASYLHD